MIFYESIREMPNERRMLGQKYSLWAKGVGNEIDIVRDNIIQAHQHVALDKKQEALTFLENAEFGIEAIKSNEDWDARELACYIKVLDDKNYVKITEAEIEDVWAKICERLTQQQIEENLERIKKK